MHDRKQRVVLVSLAASLLLALAKLAAGLWIGSLALLTDALHSSTDFLATAATLFAVRIAARPADETHTYGHGKFENLAALAEITLLLLLAGGVAVESFSRLFSPVDPPIAPWPVYAVLAVEMAVNGWRAAALGRVARETSSPALASNALHFTADVASSVAVIGGLVFAGMGYPLADPVAALAVAAIIAAIALRVAKSTVDQLVDAAPVGAVAVVGHSLDDVPGVMAVNALRVRKVGPTEFVEAEIDVPRTFSAERLGRLGDAARDAIRMSLPDAETRIEMRPVAVDDETMLERIHLAAARARLPVHHVTIQHLDDLYAVALDLEVDGTMSLEKAHDEALRLERALADELGDSTEIEIHIEPARPDPVAGSEAPEDDRTSIERDIARHAGTFGISDIHRVRVRRLASGLFVAFHCRLPEDMAIAEAHERLDQLERAVRRDWPAIRRIVSHPDPLVS